MSTFVGSSNSRYFVGVLEGVLLYTRDGAIQWEMELPFDVFTLLGVGTNGHVYIHAPDGVFVYDHSGNTVESPIKRWSRASMGSASSQLSKVAMSPEGRSICLERASLQTRVTQKIFEFLSANKASPDTTSHELIFYNVIEGTESSFYKCTASTKNPQKFLWEISSDFTWIVMAEPEKNGNKIRLEVVHVPSQTVYHSFGLGNSRIHALKVSWDGTALVDASNENERELILVTIEGEQYRLTPPAVDYDIVHLGRDFVAIRTRPTPFLLIKRFDDRLKSQADLRPLEQLKIEFDFSFNERDGLDLIAYVDGQFKIQHSNVEFLETDAHRWKDIAKAQETAAAELLYPRREPEPSRVERPARLAFEPSAPTEPAASASPDWRHRIPRDGVDDMLPIDGAPDRKPIDTPSSAPRPSLAPPALPTPPRLQRPTSLPSPAASVRAPIPPPTPPAASERKAPEAAAPALPSAPAPVESHGRNAPPRITPPEAPTQSRPSPPRVPAVAPASPLRPPPSPSRPAAEPEPDTHFDGIPTVRASRPPARSQAPAPADEAVPADARASSNSSAASTAPRVSLPAAAVEDERASAAKPVEKAPSAALPPKPAPRAKPPTAAGASTSAAPPPVLDEAERKKTMRLLEMLEQRLAQGQVSEATYVDLKSKYKAKLGLAD